MVTWPPVHQPVIHCWRLPPLRCARPLPVSRGLAVLGNTTTSVMGFCSAVTLAFATIFSLVAAALLAIAFSTDNWITINVNRKDLTVKVSLSLTPRLPTLYRRLEGPNNYISPPELFHLAICTILSFPARQ